ncbi:flagellar biosynthetic protein FliO [Salibacterium halotolerans]|uniref:Flagellar protein n=1 Tax=Salibacterium halotolerans TaxID=1884432 RepID=A0A1I5MEB5_9BACI|nr:flagellar biosynthetic protein FliO [Salibacterium halotolerans]SFP07859.1 flagellar protein FliO/FliZ [Salibacterium halotolerans]
MYSNKAVRLTLVLLAWFLFPLTMQASPGENQFIGDILENSPQQEENQNTEENTTTPEESTETTNNMDFAESTNVFSMLVQLFLALGAVIALMYLLLRFINKRSQRFQSNRTMQNLGGVPLGQNKSVQLVKVGQRLLVVGVGDSIQLLKEVDNEEEMEELLEPNRGNEQGPLQRLQSFFPKKTRQQESQTSDASSFQKVLEGQLGEMKKVRKNVRRHLKEYDK